MKTVIVAAGMGSRLWEETYNVPKTLLPYEGGTILSKIMGNFRKAGIDEFVVVVGYHSHFIKNYLANHINGNGLQKVSAVENRQWDKGNGISVLSAGDEVGDSDFILSMSDHIVSVEALRRIIDYKSDKNLLLVDQRINQVFDIDDATKVLCRGKQIIDIGKSITDYNGVDCGIFKLTGRFFEAMNDALNLKQDSISAAIKILIDNNDMEAVFLQAEDQWIDIDTPEAYCHCLDNMKL
jgi:choline kinase